MLVTKTAINVIGEIAKKGYLIINKNCKSDLQNSESLFYLKIFFSKILLTQKKSNCYIGTATGNGFENGGFAMRKAKKCNTGKKKFVVVWLALVVLFLGSFIRPVDVQAAKVKLNKSAVTIYRGASTLLKVSGSKKKVKWSSSKKSVVSDVSTASEGKLIKELSQLADEISTGLETLKADTAKALATEDPLANAKAYQTVVLSDMDELRKSVDAAETLIPDALLPYPTYDKLLFSV